MAAHAKSTRGWRWPIVATVGVLGIVTVIAVHGYASSLSALARDDTRPLRARRAAVDTAQRLEPFNPQLEVTEAIVRAEELLHSGNVDSAYFLLLPYSRSVRGDEQFKATYRRVVDAKWVLDARKAHLQHGREQEGGKLDPDDVLK